jgi:hypothetical protein
MIQVLKKFLHRLVRHDQFMDFMDDEVEKFGGWVEPTAEQKAGAWCGKCQHWIDNIAQVDTCPNCGKST